MENVKVVLEDVKNLRSSVKNLLETAERLSEYIFSIKQLARKERDQKKKKEYKNIIEEINFQLYGIRRDLEDLEDSDLFRDKIDIPKHTK